jgi:predicted  nucleic acid-binding Zn-ribbon protein
MSEIIQNIKLKARIADLEESNARYGALLADTESKLDKAMVEIEAYNEIETDLNTTISYLEMGVATWKTRAEELEAELNMARLLIKGIIETNKQMGYNIIADGLVIRCAELGITLPTDGEKEGSDGNEQD